MAQVATKKGGYVVRDRFRMDDRREGDRLLSVRPRAYLRDGRLLGYGTDPTRLRACSNRDHLVLEALATAFVQRPTPDDTMIAIPVSAVLALVMPDLRTRDVVASLERLLTARMSVPTYPSPMTDRTHAAASREAFAALRCVAPVTHPKPSELDGCDRFEFPPLLRYAVVDRVLQFELSPILRDVLSRMRHLGDRAPVDYLRYQRLDIARLAGMWSGYSIALYKHIAYLIGHSQAPRTIDLRISWTEVAEIVSLRLQKSGSTKGQVEHVLQAAQRDLDRDQGDTEILLRWRGDDGRFLQEVEAAIRTTLPPLDRLASRRLVTDGHRVMRDRSGKAVSEGRLSPDDLVTIAFADEPRYAVTLSTWAKIAHLIKGRASDIAHYAEAFGLAIDEMLRMSDARFRPWSPGFDTSPVRGRRLWDLIEHEGVQRAAVHFALAEKAAPDLTHPATKSYIRGTGALRHVLRDRQARHAASKLKPGPDGRTPLPELVNRFAKWSDEQVAAYHAAVAQHAAEVEAATLACAREKDPVRQRALMDTIPRGPTIARPPTVLTDEQLDALHVECWRRWEEAEARKSASAHALANERAEGRARKRERTRVARNERRRSRYAATRDAVAEVRDRVLFAGELLSAERDEWSEDDIEMIVLERDDPASATSWADPDDGPMFADEPPEGAFHHGETTNHDDIPW